MSSEKFGSSNEFHGHAMFVSFALSLCLLIYMFLEMRVSTTLAHEMARLENLSVLFEYESTMRKIAAFGLSVSLLAWCARVGMSKGYWSGGFRHKFLYLSIFWFLLLPLLMVPSYYALKVAYDAVLDSLPEEAKTCALFASTARSVIADGDMTGAEIWQQVGGTWASRGGSPEEASVLGAFAPLATCANKKALEHVVSHPKVQAKLKAIVRQFADGDVHSIRQKLLSEAEWTEEERKAYIRFDADMDTFGSKFGYKRYKRLRREKRALRSEREVSDFEYRVRHHQGLFREGAILFAEIVLSDRKKDYTPEELKAIVQKRYIEPKQNESWFKKMAMKEWLQDMDNTDELLDKASSEMFAEVIKGDLSSLGDGSKQLLGVIVLPVFVVALGYVLLVVSLTSLLSMFRFCKAGAIGAHSAEDDKYFDVAKGSWTPIVYTIALGLFLLTQVELSTLKEVVWLQSRSNEALDVASDFVNDKENYVYLNTNVGDFLWILVIAFVLAYGKRLLTKLFRVMAVTPFLPVKVLAKHPLFGWSAFGLMVYTFVKAVDVTPLYNGWQGTALSNLVELVCHVYPVALWVCQLFGIDLHLI